MRLFSDVSSQVDNVFFSRALMLAEKGRGATAPNPLVGCVIVRDGSIVGEGFHPRAGEPHAEIFALRDAGAQAEGADVYVTLEPCSHLGKTPPCTDALITAGVLKVYIGMGDPNPDAAGGAQLLRAAGIEVEFASDPGPFAALNEGWLKLMATGVPLVTVKLGSSLDGHTSFALGERAAITGPSGSRVTRMLRADADAVLVGAATVIADNPALTVRAADGILAARQPIRVVLVRDHAPLTGSHVFSDGAAPTLILASDRVCDELLDILPSHIEVVCFPAKEGLCGALRALGDRGIANVLIEPGPRLFSALWNESLIDRLIKVTAGGMAGIDAPPPFVGAAQREGDVLVREMAPVNAGIVGDVSVTVWEPANSGFEPAE